MESENILIKVNPKDVIFFDKTIESIDNLGIVTVLKGKEGLINIMSPFSLRQDLIEVLNNLGKNYELLTEQEKK
jgi:hypothetical protein